MLIRLVFILTLIFLSTSCGKKKEEIYFPTKLTNPYEVYNEGLEAFKRNDFFLANKKFSEAELNFSEPSFAAKSAIMASYALYGINFIQKLKKV